MSDLTHQRLRELVRYDSQTGEFYARVSRPPLTSGSRIKGSPDSSGYLQITIDWKQYKAHRLAWLYEFGAWPREELDHANGVRTDNRIGNLREYSRYENAENLARSSKNTSGFTGVSFSKVNGRWRSKIDKFGKTYHLGLFDSPEEAYEAYLEAKARLHKFQPVPRYEKPAAQMEHA